MIHDPIKAAREARRRISAWAPGVEAGQRLRQRQAAARLFDVKGPERERQTAAGGLTFVRPILDPRLALSPQERAVGNTYGAAAERAATGPSAEFLKVRVDTSRTGGGGLNETHLLACQMVDCARLALNSAPPIRYGTPRRRGKHGLAVGHHGAVRLLRLANDVCVAGLSLTEIALAHGWWAERLEKGHRGEGQVRVIVPDRQRKALAQGLRDALETVAAAWEAAGYMAPHEMGSVEGEI